MDPTAIIALASEVAGVLNKLLSQLPTRDQRVMDEFYKFVDLYHIEIARADADHDDLMLWKERQELLLGTVIKMLREPAK